MRITVVGGTGYAGTAIVHEANARGHQVRSLSRHRPESARVLPGVRYETGSLLDAQIQRLAATDTEVLVSGLSPRGDLDGHIVEVEQALAGLAASAGVRFGVVGGSGSLRLEAAGPHLAETDQLPPEAVSEATQMLQVLRVLERAPHSLDWFLVSPAFQFGAWIPSEPRGNYRVGTDVALFDGNGVSAIDSADLALAILDEIETPRHHRAHFGVAY